MQVQVSYDMAYSKRRRGEDIMVYYDNGKIKEGYDTYNCEDDADMQIFCDRINKRFFEQSIENEKLKTQFLLIKKILGVEE